jgi:hypothetical protein
MFIDANHIYVATLTTIAQVSAIHPIPSARRQYNERSDYRRRAACAGDRSGDRHAGRDQPENMTFAQ